MADTPEVPITLTTSKNQITVHRAPAHIRVRKWVPDPRNPGRTKPSDTSTKLYLAEFRTNPEALAGLIGVLQNWQQQIRNGG